MFNVFCDRTRIPSAPERATPDVLFSFGLGRPEVGAGAGPEGRAAATWLAGAFELDHGVEEDEGVEETGVNEG